MKLALFLALSVSILAQSVEVGAEAGVPITHDFTATGLAPIFPFGSCILCGTQRTVPYLIGPKVQIHLWHPIYIDAEAIYSRADYALWSGTFLKHGVDRWEIPILLKLQLNSQHFVRPFVAAGVSFEHSFDSILISSPSATAGPGTFNSAIGSTIAAGASLRFARMHPSIEVRYTRWSGPPNDANALGVISKQDEVQILAGFTFAADRSATDSRGVLEGPPSARRVLLGVKAGALLTDAMSASVVSPAVSVIGTCVECGTSRTLPYVLGPALEVRLIGSLSASVEALYSRASYLHTSQLNLDGELIVTEDKHTVGRWEAPLLLKYAFKMNRLTPFVSGGASVQYDRDASVGKISVLEMLPPAAPQFSSSTSSGPLTGSWVVGPTAGIGASVTLGRVRPSLELRYTHWLDRAVVVGTPFIFAPPVPVPPPTIASTRNQLQILLGIMF